MTEPLTAKRIQTILHRHFYAASEIIIPRFTPKGWWECDLWRLTKAGIVDEYEIKLSVADFRADATKEMRSRMKFNHETLKWDEWPSKNKHAILAGSDEGPNRFWFVMPEEVADKVAIPAFAGLISLRGWGGVDVRARAPKRHGRKWDGDKLKLLMTFYHRYWHHEGAKKDDIALEESAA